MFFSSLIAAVQIYTVTFYYHNTVLVTAVTASTAILLLAKHKFSKTAIALFCVTGTLGFFAEAIVVTNGAWTYAEPHILGLPIWLPIIWGSVGIVSINMVKRFS